MSAIQEPPTQEATTAPPPALNLAKVIQQMLEVSDKVSDLIFSPGRPPQIELAGKLQPGPISGFEKLSPTQTVGIARLIIGQNASGTQALDKSGSPRLSFIVPQLSLFPVT